MREVLRVVLRAPSLDEVVVVNDGSTDDTADMVCGMPGVRLVNLPVNRGKGAAMCAGVAATDADVLVFLDADLIGLKVEHIEALLAPVRTRKVKMAIGMFRGGRRLTDLSQKLVPHISGQRAIRRDVFEQIPNLRQTRYGVETAITRHCDTFGVPTEIVMLAGVTHPMKEEKLGFLRGFASRSRMYYEIFKIKLDPREPHRVRPGRSVRQRAPRIKELPRFLRRFHVQRKTEADPEATPYWFRRYERTWSRRRRASRSK